MALSTIDLAALVLSATATFSWFNQRFMRMPHTAGLVIMGLAVSLLLVGLERVFPGRSLRGDLTAILHQVDFSATLLDGMLAFLLFAGALHVNLGALRSRAWAVGAMATVGVLISTAIVGIGFWLLADVLGMHLSLSWALVFGALISPTDPVAVLGTLKAVRIPKSLELDLTGESLFNDGIAIVVFLALLAVADGSGTGGAAGVARLFGLEALGGAVFGLVTGYVAYRAMRTIDDYPIEVLISLALVTGSYAVAHRLGLSGPITVVVAGLLVGNRGPTDAFSDVTQRYMFGFWTLVDEMLNAVLFLLIGLEVLVLRFNASFAWVLVATVPLVLAARFAAVALPATALARWQHFAVGSIPVLTWGGLRGGISVALALSLPEMAAKPLILAATYAVVVFTIVVQGLSLRRLVERVVR